MTVMDGVLALLGIVYLALVGLYFALIALYAAGVVVGIIVLSNGEAAGLWISLMSASLLWVFLSLPKDLSRDQ